MGRPAAGPVDPARALRLVTFNVHHATVGADGPVDLDRLAGACDELDADVIALQEVEVGMRRSGRVDQVAELGRRLDADVAFAPALRRSWRGRTGVGLLVRGEVVGHQVRRLPRAGRNIEPRVGLLAEVVVAGIRLSVAVTHLGLRGEGLVQLPAVLDALGGLPLPRVLLGDLNLRPPRVAPLVRAAGYELADGACTFPAPDRRIDHVAVAGLAITAVEVPTSPMSDHRPLLVEVTPTP